MLVSHSVNLNSLSPIVPTGLQQTIEITGRSTAGTPICKRQYFVGQDNVDEPKRLETFGRFFPYPEHKFRIQMNIVQFNQGSDFQPNWVKIYNGPNQFEFIRRQTTRIHIRTKPQI